MEANRKRGERDKIRAKERTRGKKKGENEKQVTKKQPSL